jgi:hypothetical protein
MSMKNLESATALVQLTDYQAKYFVYELTKRCPADSVEKLAGALIDTQVDLNPHQIDAALFAFRSPLSKGAILADEVGLGKTIEAGLVLSQRWAERKRKILVITHHAQTAGRDLQRRTSPRAIRYPAGFFPRRYPGGEWRGIAEVVLTTK